MFSDEKNQTLVKARNLADGTDFKSRSYTSDDVNAIRLDHKVAHLLGTKWSC